MLRDQIGCTEYAGRRSPWVPQNRLGRHGGPACSRTRSPSNWQWMGQTGEKAGGSFLAGVAQRGADTGHGFTAPPSFVGVACG